MTRLRPVPDVRPRAVLYLRQSITHDDSVSLELQEAAGRDYCQRMGYDIVAVEADPGITGRTWKRPAVQRTMQMIDDGHADVIVLWKWSRLSRSRRDWAVAADRADVAGGRIESSTEAVDVSTATGRLTRGMLVELAAFESDRIGEVWKEVHSSRIAQGLAPNGKPKFGYRWDPDAKIHRPDPVTGPVLAETYARYIAGETIYSLVRWLNGAGYRTTAGGLWADRTLRRVLDTSFAVGRIQWRGEEHPGAHEPLIDEGMWQAFQDARVVRRRRPAGFERSQYLLSGLVRCGRCEGTMTAGQFHRDGKWPAFRCKQAKERGPEHCTAGYVGVAVLERAVLAWLAELAAEVDEESEAARATAAVRVAAEGDARRLSREVQRVDEALHRLTLQLAEELVPVDAYRSARAELEERKVALVGQLDEVGRASRAARIAPQVAARSLLERWDKTPVEQRRESLRRLIAHVKVWTGRPTGRIVVVPIWETG